MKKRNPLNLLRTQIIIFSVVVVLLLISLLLLLVPVVAFGSAGLIPLLVLLIFFLLFLYGLIKKRKFAYYFGFFLISISIILCLWWQVQFKNLIIPALKPILSYASLNAISIVNVLIVTFFLIILAISFYVQVKLRDVLKE